jgi:hypothetical protein
MISVLTATRVMGLLIGGAVFPAAFTIVWKKQTRIGAISGCVCGLAAGLIAWLTTAYHYYGEITVATTGTEYATLAGNLAAIMTGLIVTTVISLIKPDDFDWEITRSINALPVSEGVRTDGAETPERTAPPSLDEKEDSKTAPGSPIAEPSQADAEDSPSSLRSAFKLACISSFMLTFILDFLLPMPMFFSHYIFSKGFFTAWVVISFIWVFVSSAISCFLPIWETRTFWGELWGRIRAGGVVAK